MHILRLMALTGVGLMITGTAVVADEIVVTHRSGKVQTISIDSNTDPVEQISFRKTDTTTPGNPGKTQTPPAPTPPPQVQQQSAPQQPPAADKPPVKFKWAAPAAPY